MLLSSKEDPVARSLGKKLANRMGCDIVHLTDEPLNDLEPIVKRMKLEWKDVAYMGKLADGMFPFHLPRWVSFTCIDDLFFPQVTTNRMSTV